MRHFDTSRRHLLSEGPPAALLLIVMLLLGACGNPSYTCTDESGHCYGVAQLQVPDNDVVGTSFNAVSLNGGDGHISDEIWLVQKNSSACSNASNQCWVEIGTCAGEEDAIQAWGILGR
jgi:hypothetical protein